MKKSIKFTVENKYKEENGKRKLVLDKYLRSVEISFKGYEDWENILENFIEYVNLENNLLNVEISGNPFNFKDESGDTIIFETGLYDNDKEAINDIKMIWKEFKKTLSKEKITTKTTQNTYSENIIHNNYNTKFNEIISLDFVKQCTKNIKVKNEIIGEEHYKNLKPGQVISGYCNIERKEIIIDCSVAQSIGDLLDTFAHEIAHLIHNNHSSKHKNLTMTIMKLIREEYLIFLENIQKSIVLYKNVLYNIDSEGGKKMKFKIKRYCELDLRIRKMKKRKEYYNYLEKLEKEDDIF